jgi:hypothetical protein
VKPTIAISLLLTCGHPHEFFPCHYTLDYRRIWRGEWDSNPRALSNMGLAIPRPTRLGDPRTHIETRFSLLLIIVSKYSELQWQCPSCQVYWIADDKYEI